MRLSDLSVDLRVSFLQIPQLEYSSVVPLVRIPISTAVKYDCHYRLITSILHS